MIHVDELEKSKKLQNELSACQLENDKLIRDLLSIKRRVDALHLITMTEVLKSLPSPINENAMATLRVVALLALDILGDIEDLETDWERPTELPF